MSYLIKIQSIWRGYRTRMLYRRYLFLTNVSGFTTMNPSIYHFIKTVPLNI